MEKKKTTSIGNGFLVLYDWLPALQTLGGEEVKALLLALIDRQRNGTPIPPLGGMTDVFARMIEPTIKRRLDGAKAATGKQKQNAEGTPEDPLEDPLEGTLEDTLEGTLEDTLEGTPEDTLEGTLEASKAKKRKAEQSIAIDKAELQRSMEAELMEAPAEAEAPCPPVAPPKEASRALPISAPMPMAPPAPQCAPLQAPLLPQEELFSPPSALSESRLTDREREILIDGGVSAEYIDKRLDRAAHFAASHGKDVPTVLLDWWARDKHKYHRGDRGDRAQKPSASQFTPTLGTSFDFDDFFRAAVERGTKWDEQ